MDKKECTDLGLFIRDNKILVSSRKVAEVYGKEHSHIMRDIRNLIDLVPQTNESNFVMAEYEDKKGEIRPEYLMDRQGFLILITSFTGGKPLKINSQTIKLFDEMEVKLIYKVRDEYDFSKLLHKSLDGIYEIISQYMVDNYKIDFYIPKINLAIEYDEEQHQYQQKEDIFRQKYIQNKIECDFIRVEKGKELKGLNLILKYINNYNKEECINE